MRYLPLLALVAVAFVLTDRAVSAGRVLRRRRLRLQVDPVTGSVRQVPDPPSPDERAAFERFTVAAAAAWAASLCLLVPLSLG